MSHSVSHLPNILGGIALKRVEAVFTTIKEIGSQTKQLLNKKID